MSRIQLRRDSVTNWLTVNPVLALGELGIAYDGVGADAAVVTIRIGNGVATWTQLPDFGGNGDLTQEEADVLYASAAQGLKADTALQAGPTVVEYVQDIVAAMSVGGQGVQIAYNDSLGTITFSVSSLAITEVFPVSDQAAMLALAAQRGDVAIRSDVSAVYILSTDDPTQLANWILLPTPLNAVLSVNGLTGAVTISPAALGLGNVTNTSDADKPVSTLQAQAIAAAQAAAVQRSNHTGTQSADTLTDGTTNKAFLATERTKLAGIAPGATANATDAQLRDRSTHTGTQLLATISDAGNAASRDVGTTAGTVAAGDAPATAQAAAVATASADATTKANAAQAAAISAASTDATTKADAKVADAINDGTTTVAPSQNAVYDALALKAPLASPTFTGTVTVPDASFSLAKLANIATARFLGRRSAGSGPPEEMTLAQVKADMGIADQTGAPRTVEPWTVTAAVTMGSSNRTYFERVTAGETISATKIACRVSTSSGNICLAVYSNTGSGAAALPATRQGTTGSVSCPAGGYAEVSLGATVTIGIGQWMSISCDNATASFATCGPADISLSAPQFFAGLQHLSTSTFPAPSPAGSPLPQAERRYQLMAVA